MILHFNKAGVFITANTNKLAADDVYDFVEITDDNYEENYNYNLDGTKGDAYTIFVPTDDELDEMSLETLRTERNRLLSETDWSQSADVPEATRTLWQSYRQALRDITNTYNSLNTVVWPSTPQ